MMNLSQKVYNDNKISLQYSNVYPCDILCKNIEIISSSSKNSSSDDGSNNKIMFQDCSVLIEGSISYKNDYSHVEFGIFLS